MFVPLAHAPGHVQADFAPCSLGAWSFGIGELLGIDLARAWPRKPSGVLGHRCTWIFRRAAWLNLSTSRWSSSPVPSILDLRPRSRPSRNCLEAESARDGHCARR